MSDRQTVSAAVELIEDPEARAALEAENALLQFDAVLDPALEAADASGDETKPALEPMTDLLHRYLARQLDGILAAASSTDTAAGTSRKFH